MDSLLSGLFGDDESEAKKVGKATDFVRRYNEGAPEDNISDEEAVSNYNAVANKLTPEQLEESATDAFGRMSAEQRKELGTKLKQAGAGDIDVENPQALASAATQLSSSQPGGLAGLLGGGSEVGAVGGSDLMSSPLVKAALGGIAAAAIKKFAGGSGGGLGDMINGLLGGGGSSTARAGAQSGSSLGLDDFLGGLTGGSGGGKSGQQSGGGLEDIIGGLIGGGKGGGGGSLEDMIGGLIGGGDSGKGGRQIDPGDLGDDERKRRTL